MTRAFDVRHGTVEGILTWFSETDALGRSLWRLPEVRR